MRTIGLVLALALIAIPRVSGASTCTSQVLIEARILEVDAHDLFGCTPQAFPYTVNRAIRDYAAPRFDLQLPWTFKLAYNNDDYLGTDDPTWTGLLAYERPVNQWGWGVQAPEQYTDRSGYGSLWYEGVTGYAYYDLDTYGRVGGFGHINYAFSDVDGLDNELSYGAGLFASYRYNFSDAAWLTPTVSFTYYSPGQANWDNSTIFSVGTRLDYSASANLGLWAKLFYNADTSNDALDDSYLDWGIGLNWLATDRIEVGGGIGTTESFEDFDRMTIQIGVRMTY